MSGPRTEKVNWLPVVLILGALLLGMNGVRAAEISHLGADQKVLVICVKWSDYTSTRMTSAQDWADLLNDEVNDFYKQATFNQSYFKFETPTGVPDNGWLDLGYASSGYDFWKVGQDAVKLIDPYVDFSKYNRALVITNWWDFGGQGGGPWWWKVNEGAEATVEESGSSFGVRLMTMAICNEWKAHDYGNHFDEAGSVMAHELGHELGAPTHYGDVHWFPGMTTDDISPWCIMGTSPTLNHFIGWAKLNRSWIPSGPRVRTVGPPVGSNIDETITLHPQETATAGVQLIRIPFTPVTGDPYFNGFCVENRRFINGDDHLPSQGVLITLVDEHPDTIRNCVVMPDPSEPTNMERATLDVGGVFTDAGRNLRISVTGQAGDNYTVRVQYDLPPTARPDPQIIPWGGPPWETVDMWIDSEKNGWDVYRYTDGMGEPVGNGDDPWVEHDNRVYVRVRNIGPGLATNVRVFVRVNSPPGMGDAGANWDPLSTIIIPSLTAGASAEEYVNWRPTVGEHTCLKAEIQEIAGELTGANNRAQENVTHFDSATGSPFKPVELKIRVNNPFEKDATPVQFHVRNVPPGWAIRLDPPALVLKPGGFDWVSFQVYPSGSPTGKVPANLQGQLEQTNRIGYTGKPRIEALVQYANTYRPIGGVDVWTHLVNPSQLTCEVVAPPPTRLGASGPARALRLTPAVASGEEELSLAAQINPKPPILRPGPGPLLLRSPEFKAGTQFTVRGKLTPAVDDAIISVEFATAGYGEMRFAKAGPTGEYRVAFATTKVGTWTAQAFFAGNDTLARADSPRRAFKIVK